MSEPTPPKLPFGVKILVGAVLPQCGLGLLGLLMSDGFRSDEAGGFAMLGVLMGVATLTGISFVVDLVILSVIPLGTRGAAFVAGCIIPLIAFVLLAAARTSVK